MTYQQQALSLAATSNELFDVTVPETNCLYLEAIANCKSEAISRDTSSWAEIVDGIQKAHSTYKGDGVVVLNGAYAHIIGAIVQLARSVNYNLNYIPVGGSQISTDTLDFDHKTGGNKPLSKKDIEVQIGRAVGVTKHLGFSNLEAVREFLQNIPRNPANSTLTIVVSNETGLHHLYGSGAFKVAIDKTFRELTTIISSSTVKPSFVFFSGEDVNIDGYKMMLADKRVYTGPQQFLVDIQQVGIPIEISAFGHRDRIAHGTRIGFQDSSFMRDRFPPRPMFGGEPSFSSKGFGIEKILGDAAKKKL